jgi:hypothetical protein
MKRSILAFAGAGLVAVVVSFSPVGNNHLNLVPRAHAMSKGCSLETVRGSYGFYRSGTTPNGPLGAVGVSVFDGKGGSSFSQTIRSDGETTSDLFTDGAVDAMYVVNRDCTAQFLNPDGSAFGHAVVVGGGDEIYFMSLSDHNTITGVMRRIVISEDHD